MFHITLEWDRLFPIYVRMVPALLALTILVIPAYFFKSWVMGKIGFRESKEERATGFRNGMYLWSAIVVLWLVAPLFGYEP